MMKRLTIAVTKNTKSGRVTRYEKMYTTKMKTNLFMFSKYS